MAGALGSAGGARKPYVARSRASFAVPVFDGRRAGAGRRPVARARGSSTRSGSACGSVLPWRMSVDEEGGLRAHGLDRPSAWRRAIDDLARRVADLEDHPRRDARAAVGDRAVGRGQVERARPRPCRSRRPDRPAGTAFVPPAKRIPNFVGPVGDRVAPDALERPDRRDVQRVLERLPDEDRPAVQLVGVARRPAAAELGGDVEEEAARRQPLRVEGAGVDDRLEGRARLAGAVAGGVVLRLELRGSPACPGSSRRSRRRPGRRRSGSRARRAPRCGGPCRGGR